MSLTKVTNSMILGAAANVLDYGADATGTDDSSAAFTAALTASNTVYIPVGSFKLASVITIPPYGQVFGAGINNTTITASGDNVAFVLQYWSQLRQMKILKSGTHTKNLIEVGSATLDAGRATISNVWVQGAGADGIQLIFGNLGTLENITSISNGMNGIRFKAGNADLNAWTLQGYIDLRDNTNDGLHLEAGAALGDNLCSVANFITGVTAQQNTRYGIFIGTRSNFISCYAEANTVGDTQLGAYARGNEVKTTNGYVVDDSINPQFNIVQNYNATGGYQRIFQNLTQFSGVSTAGFGLSNDDDVAGTFTCQKTAVRQYSFTARSSGITQQVIFTHEDFPSAKLDMKVDGVVETTSHFLNSTVTWISGVGSPENVLLAPVGSIYSRTDGGAGTTLYVKETGTGNTGWVAK